MFFIACAVCLCIDTSVRIHLTLYSVISIKISFESFCLQLFLLVCTSFHLISTLLPAFLFFSTLSKSLSSSIIYSAVLHSFCIIHESLSIYTNYTYIRIAFSLNQFQQQLTFTQTHTHIQSDTQSFSS